MADEDEDTLCPVARSTRVVGDRWSVVIVRELMLGVNRFQDLQAQTGATGQLLAGRLRRLEADGIVAKRAYSSRPLRYEYLLTPMGFGLAPVIMALRTFGETWCKDPAEGLAVRMFHRQCGAELDLQGGCPTCRRLVPLPEMMGQPTPAYAAERAARAAEFTERRRALASSQTETEE